MMLTCRKRKSERRRDIKAVSAEAVHAQPAFCHHFKSSSPALESTRPPADPLPVQLNPGTTASGPCKLVLRGGSAGGETPGLAHCPVCYDVLVPETGSRQLRDHVTTGTGSDVTKRRPVMASARCDAGRCLVTSNRRRDINSFNSIYSV